MGVDTRQDPYYWLNERDNAEVIQYLNDENAYTDSVLSPVKTLKADLFNELKARIKEDDSSVPYFKHGYFYYTRFETGKEYPIFCRKKAVWNHPNLSCSMSISWLKATNICWQVVSM